MSHHRHRHHPEHRLHDREDILRVIGRRRQQNLAWFGLVMVVTILAFLGIALLTANPHISATPSEAPPVTIDQPVAPSPVAPVEPVAPPPAVHKHHHRHVAPVAPSCNLPAIPAYAADGSVVAIPNPDCNY